MITTKIVYDHRGRSKKDEVGAVEFRVTIDRQSYYINSGVSVLKKNFSDGQIINQSDSDELNERIQILFGKLQSEINRLIANGDFIDINKLRAKIWTLNEEKTSTNAVVDWIEEQVPLMNLREGTVKHYRTLRRRLIEYGKINQWSDIDVEGLCNFDSWLHRLKSDYNKQLLSDSAIYTYHKCLKAVINRAVLFGKLTNNPYWQLRGRFKRGDSESVQFLSDEEMKKIEAIHPYPGTPLAIARDLFVFQMHTGLSFVDTQNFDFTKYKKIGEKYVTIGQRVKTGIQYIVCLSDECVRILQQYNYTLPIINNSDYNKQLKNLAVVAGVNRRLHSHVARHSFATKMLASGAKIENVSKMLGHASVSQTQRYAKVLAESVIADFEKMESKPKDHCQ